MKFLLLIFFVFSTPTLADISIKQDIGTSFSAHGYGLSVGYMGEDLSVFIGTGHSKNNRAGLPLSLTGAWFLNFTDRLSLHIDSGWTWYQGKGEKEIVFSNSRKSYNFRYKTDAYWDFVYMRFGAGFRYLFGKSQNFFIIQESGFSTNIYSRVKTDMRNIDQSNIGHPIGLEVGDYGAHNNYMGKGDWGIYLSVSIGVKL